MNLVWFRNDLRIADHPALTAALETGEDTFALYINHPKQHQIHGESPQKLEFIKAHVKDLRKRLKKLNIELTVKSVPQFSDVPTVFSAMLERYNIGTVYFHHSYWVNELQRDTKIIRLLQARGVDVQQFHTNYLLPPATVTKGNGEMYHVFTPYKNKYIEQLKVEYKQPLPIPVAQKSMHKESMGDLPNDFSSIKLNANLSALWPVGEKAAHKCLKQFISNNNYKKQRDFPAIAGTSGLSPYLTIGVISAKQCLAHMLKHIGEDAFYSTWVSELIWRDFYNDLLFAYPRLAKHKVFKADAVDNWRQDKKLYEQWQQGKTGFPIVDAGMRQLLQEGWMHNRVRMIVASFLTKLCLLDWRLGEAHFMAHLLDGDLASNNGGWQWSSATGCDAAPYFRIFNPTSQSKKFDPEGTYIKKYVKELAEVPTKKIHDPDVTTREANDYPQPVIDYKQARTEALRWFK